jgi:hypothetical protein
MKKTAYILLALILALSTFAGCSSRTVEKPSRTTKAPSTTKTITETYKVTEPPAESEPNIIVDMQGQNVPYAIGAKIWSVPSATGGGSRNELNGVPVFLRLLGNKGNGVTSADKLPVVSAKDEAKITVTFESNPPDSVKLYDCLLDETGKNRVADADGNYNYNNNGTEIEIITVSPGVYSFTYTEDPDEATVASGMTLYRGYRLHCTWGKDYYASDYCNVEYGFMVKRVID